jgi:hypothetical protein
MGSVTVADTGRVHAAVRAGIRSGLCLLPTKDDGSKRPDTGAWRQFQERGPTPDEVRGFAWDTRAGYGMVSGDVSGRRECWDFDDAEAFESFVAEAQRCGLGEVVDRIRVGYEDRTPGGGRRWIVEFPEEVVFRDCTLARRPGRAGEPAVKTLIELPTFAVLAPSNGRTHHSGLPYERVSGGFSTIASYTADEREGLIALARSSDRMPRREAYATRTTGATSARPGDAYTARTTWPEVLEPAGWSLDCIREGVTYWRRPGKQVGVSATTNYAGNDLLWVFSSSTKFDPDKSYSRFAAFAVLHHGGDFASAARTLAAQDHGAPAPTVESAASHREELDARILRELESARVQREVRRRLDAEERPLVVMPEFVTLRGLLDEPDEDATHRIEGWQPRDSRVMLAAQFKAGKTTMIANVTRSLLDGDPFLDVAKVVPLTGALALIDTEMSKRQLKAWLRDQNIRSADRVLPLLLKGRLGSFDLLRPEVRARWVAKLRAFNVEYVVLDCLRPVLDFLGLDENRDAGRFLVAFDALLAEAGVAEALMVHHMGHASDRPRGDSRLRDWPDAEWRIVRRSEEPASPRFVSAYGRDVDIPESALLWDASGRRLRLVGGSRRDAVRDRKRSEALDAILDLLGLSDEALNGRAIKDKLAGGIHARDLLDDALGFGVETRRLVVTPGPHNAKLYRPGVRMSGGVLPVSAGRADSPVSGCPAGSKEPDARTPALNEDCDRRGLVSGPDTAAPVQFLSRPRATRPSW